MTQVISSSLLRVIILGVLIAGEGFAIALLNVVSTGKMPTQVQCLGFALAAFIQLATYLITFLETGVATPAPANPPVPVVK